MESARVTHYFGNAWRSIKTTKNLFGKLCLLALIQFVPILGQIVALGYFLGWAREAAWGMQTPLPAHVFGRDDPGFWARGAKAFAISLLYGLIVSAFSTLLVGLGSLLIAVLGVSETVAAVIMGAVSVLVFVMCLLFAGVEVVGLVRMAIYERFGAAFQWGACFKMLFHFFGGFVKLMFTVILASIVLEVLVVPVLVAAFPGIAGTVFMGVLMGAATAVADSSSIPYETIASFLCALGVVYVALFVACYLVEVVSLMVEALLWRALGHLIARFDVASWGGRFDPLPFESSAPHSGEPDLSAACAPAEKRCHPLLVGLLSILVAALLCAGSSFAVAAIFDETYGDSVTLEDIETMFEEFSVELEGVLDELIEQAGYSGHDIGLLSYALVENVDDVLVLP